MGQQYILTLGNNRIHPLEHCSIAGIVKLQEVLIVVENSLIVLIRIAILTVILTILYILGWLIYGGLVVAVTGAYYIIEAIQKIRGITLK